MGSNEEHTEEDLIYLIDNERFDTISEFDISKIINLLDRWPDLWDRYGADDLYGAVKALDKLYPRYHDLMRPAIPKLVDMFYERNDIYSASLLKKLANNYPGDHNFERGLPTLLTTALHSDWLKVDLLIYPILARLSKKFPKNLNFKNAIPKLVEKLASESTDSMIVPSIISILMNLMLVDLANRHVHTLIPVLIDRLFSEYSSFIFNRQGLEDAWLLLAVLFRDHSDDLAFRSAIPKFADHDFIDTLCKDDNINNKNNFTYIFIQLYNKYRDDPAFNTDQFRSVIPKINDIINSVRRNPREVRR